MIAMFHIAIMLCSFRILSEGDGERLLVLKWASPE